MEQRVTTEQLIYKIGALTLENDILRSQIEQMQNHIAELTKVEEKFESAVTPNLENIND